MRAIELAAEGLEQLRAGHALRPLSSEIGFERNGTTGAWDGHPGVERLEVVVLWQEDAPQRFQLTTLVRR